MQPAQPSTRAARRPIRRWFAPALAAFSAFLFIAGGAVALNPVEAEAATMGPGYTLPTSTLSHIGGYHPNAGSSTVVYCIEPGVNQPVGFTSTPAAARPISAGLNMIISRYGQTTNNNQAAAVAVVVWETYSPAAFAAEGGWIFVSGRAPFSERATIRALADRYIAEMNAYRPPSTSSGTVNLAFDVNPTNNYLGALNIGTMSSGTSASGTLTLTNGIFVATGTNTIVGTFRTGQSLEIRGTGIEEGYKISAAAALTGASNFYRARMAVWDTEQNRQSLGGPGGTSVLTLTGTAIDPIDRSIMFSPEATTAVGQKYVTAGDDLVDIVEPTLGVNPDGTVNEWFRDVDGYLPVKFDGVVYGPFDSAPVEGSNPAPDAPVAGTATFTTDRTSNPASSYTVTIPGGVTAHGYYTWVWEVTAAEQSAYVSLFMPEGYSWRDSFQAVETSISAPIVTTKATSNPLGLPIHDVAIVESGGVVYDGGALVFEAYLQPVGGVDPLCDASTLVWTSERIPATTDGEYNSGDFIPTSTGTIFWVERYFIGGDLVSSGVCGNPDETSFVAQLVSSTQANRQTAQTGDSLYDTAFIYGTIDPGSTIRFELYRQGATVADDVLVFSSGRSGLPTGVVNRLIEYSEAYVVTAPGNYYWVEIIENVLEEEVFRGEPRQPSESTVVTARGGGGAGFAETGSAPIGWFGAAGALLLAGLGLTIAARRKRTS